jgi:hypothetical protein
VLIRYSAQAIADAGLFGESAAGQNRKKFIEVMQEPMTDTGGPPQGFLEHLVYACEQEDSEINLKDVFDKVFDDLSRQMR